MGTFFLVEKNIRLTARVHSETQLLWNFKTTNLTIPFRVKSLSQIIKLLTATRQLILILLMRWAGHNRKGICHCGECGDKLNSL